MKRIKVRVKAQNPTKEEIWQYGDCKAFVNVASSSNKLFTVCVLNYRGKNYFVIKCDEKIMECEPI